MKIPKLVRKKECVRLTWLSYLFIAFFVFLLFLFVRNNLYNFLSPIQPVDSKVLVVEGWIDDFAIEAAYTIYKEGNYDLIITTGGPLEIGYLATHFISSADLAKATFLELGMDSSKIISISREHVLVERTYQSALALENWLQENHPEINKFNMISLGVHSRRSWYLFQKAMPEREIGVIAIRDKRFDDRKWWLTSKGMRTVLTESIGYFYVRIFM